MLMAVATSESKTLSDLLIDEFAELGDVWIKVPKARTYADGRTKVWARRRSCVCECGDELEDKGLLMQLNTSKKQRRTVKSICTRWRREIKSHSTINGKCDLYESKSIFQKKRKPSDEGAAVQRKKHKEMSGKVPPPLPFVRDKLIDSGEKVAPPLPSVRDKLIVSSPH